MIMPACDMGLGESDSHRVRLSRLPAPTEFREDWLNRF